MAQKPEDFLKIASSILNYKYEGDPDKLESFIADIEFLESMSKPETKDVCLRYIRHKIAGRAIECLPASADTKEVKDFVDALRKEIKPEPSSNIENKFTTLRVVRGDLEKFAEDTEKLAESFRRSLVLEGFTRQKASEMAIRKTQELCRRTSRSEAAKAVIDGNKYDTPSDVVSTFLAQNAIAQKERREQEVANQKRQDNKNFKKGQSSNKSDQKFKSDNKFLGKPKFNKNQKGENRGGKDRRNQNDHVIRIVSDANASTSNENASQSNAEQVFRLAPS